MAQYDASVEWRPPIQWTAAIAQAWCVVVLLLYALPSHAQDQNAITKCLSIANIDERVDCLESGGVYPDSARRQSQQKPNRVGPSFDCRAATHSIERAICGDTTLSEWDLRLAQHYQQALRLRKGNDLQALTATQRSWIQQRNSVCGAAPGAAVWSCVLDMTKERIAILSEPPQVAEALPAPQSSPIPQSPARSTPSINGVPNISIPSTVEAAPPSPTPSKSSASPPASEGGSNPILVILFVLGAVFGGIAVFNSIQRRARFAEEQRRLAAERQRLIAKYGNEIAERILAHQIWQGMTEDQLLESWGGPADRDYEIRKSKTKETWKYGQIGRNRFTSRVFLENGAVIGWKQ